MFFPLAWDEWVVTIDWRKLSAFKLDACAGEWQDSTPGWESECTTEFSGNFNGYHRNLSMFWLLHSPLFLPLLSNVRCYWVFLVAHFILWLFHTSFFCFGSRLTSDFTGAGRSLCKKWSGKKNHRNSHYYSYLHSKEVRNSNQQIRGALSQSQLFFF